MLNLTHRREPVLGGIGPHKAPHVIGLAVDDLQALVQAGLHVHAAIHGLNSNTIPRIALV